MTKTVTYTIDTANDYPSSFVNPPQALYRDNKQIAILKLGSSDDYQIYINPKVKDDNGNITSERTIEVISENTRLDYCGMEVYNDEGECLFELFIDGDDYDNDCEGAGWDELRKHMSQWWM